MSRAFVIIMEAARLFGNRTDDSIHIEWSDTLDCHVWYNKRYQAILTLSFNPEPRPFFEVRRFPSTP